jgi:anaphase-promoting complex subunit 6
MCYLRGLCFAKRNAFDRARECYKDAVRIDVQCFEAFDQLMKNSFMSPAQELAFLEELDFESVQHDDPSVAQEAAHFTKLLYTTRLSKYASPTALSDATETLSTHYNLADNPDLLLTRAEVLYTQCRFHEALSITSSILNSQSVTSIDSSSSSSATASSLGHNPALYPLHLACLYETSSHNTLFLLSHNLSQHAPHEPYTYLAIGTYYLSTNRISEARRFFSKASLMDPHSPSAWIGFAHTFAAEGEHDQAIAAYSTAARLFQGSHLPQLFLGMQHLALNNMQLALEYCVAAYEMSSGTTHTGEGFDPAKVLGGNTGGDPLVLNELGVILYHQSNLPVAVKLFRQSLGLAAELGCSPMAWVATRANLAHALRRLGRLDEALAEFDECLRTITGGSLSHSSNDLSHRIEPYNAGPSALADSASGGGSGAVAGYDDRNLIGSIHTSRGLVLLSMPSRKHEAVLALHEAVRVLGGDASGGGVAGTLLGRAVEIWAFEDGGEDAIAPQELGTPRATQSPKRRRRVLNGDEARYAKANDGISTGRKVELGLDDEADEVLSAALGNSIRERQ